MLGMIARILIGAVLGILFLVGMAVAYASDLLESPSRQQRNATSNTSPQSAKTVSFY
jgi:hypothetical protein